MSKSLQPKYRSRSPGQGICRVSTLRRSTLQGLMVVGLIIDEISNVDAKCVKVTGAQNIGQTGSRYLPSQYISERSTMQDLVVVRLILAKIWNINVNCVCEDLEHQRKLCQSQWSAKYRSRTLGQCTCQV